MLAIVLKILSILGIVLLAVLVVMLLGLVLVLFVPLTYRLSGSKDAEGLRLSVKLNWFFGLLRVRFRYPAPGRLTAKALCFPLFEMKIPPGKTVREETDSVPADADSPPGRNASRKADSSKPSEPEAAELAEPKAIDSEAAPAEAVPNAAKATNGPKTEGSPETGSEAAPAAGSGGEGEGQTAQEGGPFGKISQKVQGIKYTIYNICDKIKGIWKNISYYMELLQEENTKQLAAHAFFRAGRILKGIRPKHVKVRLLFGTGSPDTTGYLYGAYCILSAPLGAGVCVTPDFEEKRLEGEFDIAGHVLVWTFVINGLRLFLDKKLRIFLRRLKAGRKKPAAA